MLATDSSDSPGGLVGFSVSVVSLVGPERVGGLEVEVLNEVGVCDGVGGCEEVVVEGDPIGCDGIEEREVEETGEEEEGCWRAREDEGETTTLLVLL